MTKIKFFNKFGIRTQCYKTFYVMTVCNKLECLSLASLSSLVKCLLVRLELTGVKHVSGAPLYGMLLALPTTIRLCLPVTYTLAYFEHFRVTDLKSFLNLASGYRVLWWHLQRPLWQRSRHLLIFHPQPPIPVNGIDSPPSLNIS